MVEADYIKGRDGGTDFFITTQEASGEDTLVAFSPINSFVAIGDIVNDGEEELLPKIC